MSRKTHKIKGSGTPILIFTLLDTQDECIRVLVQSTQPFTTQETKGSFSDEDRSFRCCTHHRSTTCPARKYRRVSAKIISFTAAEVSYKSILPIQDFSSEGVIAIMNTEKDKRVYFCFWFINSNMLALGLLKVFSRF